MIETLAGKMTEVDLSMVRSWNQTAFVYVLIDDSEIVYVGRTANLGQRLVFHLYGTENKPPKTFTRALHIELPIGDAPAFEGALIRRFNPPLCQGAPSDETRDREVLAALGLEYHQENRNAFVARRIEIFVEAHKRARVRNLARTRAWRPNKTASRVIWKATLRFLSKHEAKAL